MGCLRAVIFVLGLSLALPSTALAGMPAPLPFNPERISQLAENPLARLQAISFFILVFFLSAFAFRGIWNFVQRDFPSLPRLTYGRAVALVFLWGLLFVIVLTMISGARELMTPGAWQRQGATYKLAENSVGISQPELELARRRQHLERLRTALWQYAAMHGGRFPGEEDLTAIPSELWEIPSGAGLRFLYISGRSAAYGTDVLAYEPEMDPDRRLVLRVNGDIIEMPSKALRELKLSPSSLGRVSGEKP